MSLMSSIPLPCSEDFKSADSSGARSNSPDDEEGRVEGSSQQEDADAVEQSPQPSEHGTASAEGSRCLRVDPHRSHAWSFRCHTYAL